MWWHVHCPQNLGARIKEVLNTHPMVRDQASSGSGSFENSGRRRKAHFRHRLAIDIQHHACGAIDHIVMRRPDVPDPTNVLRQPLSTPTFAAQDELQLECVFSSSQKELLHSRFSVRHAIAYKDQVATKTLLMRNRKMCI